MKAYYFKNLHVQNEFQMKHATYVKKLSHLEVEAVDESSVCFEVLQAAGWGCGKHRLIWVTENIKTTAHTPNHTKYSASDYKSSTKN